MARRRSSRSLTLSHNYPGLWLGAGVLAFLGGNCVYMGVRLALTPPAPAPGRGPEGTEVLASLLIAGALFLGLGALLGWLAWRWSERYEVDKRGITWHKGGRQQASLAWRDIQRIQLQDTWGRLVLEGPPGDFLKLQPLARTVVDGVAPA